ncbi:Coiled-coil domain-containing protein 93 [Parelaphostrongylus tenuis]|uniref:Coiled-coil domain-containing protein 93 n=1 Tax=Parelaphostrongylus tenuis TaxID=148309 RepID=A0AAD5MTA8_PARTN|nr:Coiled-coil domain-containing protein 93 [Parelaphostrongylus tenuis]
MAVDGQNDEEQQTLMNCLDLLIAAGYFRARIKGLATFDKIVGGMVWCLSHCNREVDADLLFFENLDIGQKIALTEKIVHVLGTLECPHSIEPHQIQGLDFIHIYPVIQWLVKMAMDFKIVRADYLKSYINYQYDKKTHMPPSIPPLCEIYDDVHVRIIPRRQFKRGKNLHFDSIQDDAQCTLAEFSGRTSVDPRPDDSTKECTQPSTIQSDCLEGLDKKQHSKLSTKAAKRIFSSIDAKSEHTCDDVSAADNLESTSDIEEQEMINMMNELDRQLKLKKEEHAKVLAEHETQLERKSQMEAILSRFTPEEIEEARALLNEYEHVRENERNFKSSSKAQLMSLYNEIQSFEEASVNSNTGNPKEIEEQLSAERLRLAESTQRVAALMFEIDSIPSQQELAQYQQRFIELFNQIESKHRNARQYVTLYNTLVDVRNYIKKDIELLSKIEDVLPLATKASFRDSFIDNLSSMFHSVEAVQKKVTDRTAALTDEKNRYVTEYNQLKERSRLFNVVVDQLKLECERNEKLREMLSIREKSSSN